MAKWETKISSAQVGISRCRPLCCTERNDIHCNLSQINVTLFILVKTLSDVIRFCYFLTDIPQKICNTTYPTNQTFRPSHYNLSMSTHYQAFWRCQYIVFVNDKLVVPPLDGDGVAAFVVTVLLVHVMDTSSWCLQSCCPQGQCEQSPINVSLPWHWILSSQICPLPAPYLLLIIRPTYLHR